MLVAKQMSELHYRHFEKLLKYEDEVKFKIHGVWVDTTYGRLCVWEKIGYLPDGPLDKKGSKKLICWINENYLPEEAIVKLKEVQDLGFSHSTQMGLSICMDDLQAPEGSRKVLDEARVKSAEFEGRDRAVFWDGVINDLTNRWFEEAPETNSMKIMGKSGARVTDTQIRQMIIAKGLLTGMDGNVNIDAVNYSLAEGIPPISYFQTCGPARRGLAGNFFTVPASGYLTRQLVAACRDVYFSEDDCGDTEGVLTPIEMARGRFYVNDEDDWHVTPEDISWNAGDLVQVRSPLTCKSTSGGLCTKCCGINPATGEQFDRKLNIGIVAAHHLSEPSTQLGLRGKHTSGSVKLDDESGSIDNVLAMVIKALGARSTSHFPISGVEVDTVWTRLKDGDSLLDATSKQARLVKELYDLAGVGVSLLWPEIVFRACSDIVLQSDGTRNFRLNGGEGEVEFAGVGTLPIRKPSWLGSMGFGYVKSRLIKAVLDSEVSLGTNTERVITTKLVDKEVK